MTLNRTLSIGLIIASLLTLLIGLHLRQEARRLAASAFDDRMQLAALQERVADLESNLASMQAADRLAPATSDRIARSESQGPTPVTNSMISTLTTRLDSLEGLLEEISASPNQWRLGDQGELQDLLRQLEQDRDLFPHIAWLSSIDAALTPEAIRRLQTLVANDRADLEARLEALEALKMASDQLGADVLGESVAVVALALADPAHSAEARRRAYSALKGRTYPFLREPLLRASGEEGSAVVRDDIVVALGHFLPDPGVAERLEWISANDPDPEVRDEAEEQLERHAPR